MVKPWYGVGEERDWVQNHSYSGTDPWTVQTNTYTTQINRSSVRLSTQSLYARNNVVNSKAKSITLDRLS